MLDTKTFANVRGGAVRDFGEGNDEQIQINNRGELIVAQGISPLATVVALGNSWVVRTTAAAAPVAAVPTTASLLTLYNAEPGGGKCAVIESIFGFVVANTAAIQSHGILVNMGATEGTIFAASLTPKPLRGARAYNGRVRVAPGQALDSVNGVQENWMSVGSSSAPVASPQIGTTFEAKIDGCLILPPGSIMGIHVLAGAATASSIMLGVRWHEIYMPALA